MTRGEQIITLLKTVNPETLWGTAIARVVQTEDSHKVMDLVIDLRSQGRDNGPLLQEILGVECYAAIMEI